MEPIALATPVAPGEETDLRLTLTAPAEPGLHAGGWALRSPEGAMLGAGSRPLRVRINVGPVPPEPSSEVYNFAEQMCSARWVAASPSRPGRLLPCPGYDRDSGGSVTRLEAPRFSNGALDDEPALILHPPFEDGGLISGTFPATRVQAGDQFRVILGCSDDAPGCSAAVSAEHAGGPAALAGGRMDRQRGPGAAASWWSISRFWPGGRSSSCSASTPTGRALPMPRSGSSRDSCVERHERALISID